MSATASEGTTLLSMSGLAKALGVAKSTIHVWTEQGVILPEIREGMVYRFDLGNVRQRLAERAKEKAAAPLA